GAIVPAGFSVDVSCTPNDAATIAEVDIAIDGEPLGMLTAAPYTLAIPSSFSDGPHALAVDCATSSRAEVSTALGVVQAPACATADDCAESSDLCYTGACIAGPKAPNGLGASCKTGGDCASGSCANDGSESRCTVPCDPSAKACPAGFTCLASAEEGVCWPSGGGGGCDAGGGAAPLCGLALLALVRRRQR
ncbi:MAG TPA: Ig-like domain-containing protein, partial [Kofleriaceae bacterium]|nr:Ig-like domain-containing protein [Kofleriaceae bacterium]